MMQDKKWSHHTVRKNVSLKAHSAYRIGGIARYFAEVDTVDVLREVAQEAQHHAVPLFILGGGTNILFTDMLFPGLILKPLLRFIEEQNGMIRVGAGTLMSELVSYATKKGLSGLEWAGGLPGTVGGAIRGNAGAFGGEIKDCIQEVTSLHISHHLFPIQVRTKKECQFDYRTSIFKTRVNQDVILSAACVLTKGNKKNIRAAVEEKITYRKKRHPLEYPNIGSIFKNVPLAHFSQKILSSCTHVIKNDPFPLVPTAYLIATVGLQGMRVGDSMISEKHPNFLVNCGDARAKDVCALIHHIKKVVKKKYGVVLEEEIIKVG